VDVQLVKRAVEERGQERLLHVYGPTESTTFSTWHHVRQVEELARTVPIGNAICNTQAYILDDELQLVPMGAVGELFISGEGLARGYWMRPSLTAEKFLPDWPSGKAGARMYRTGDRVRYGHAGGFEFLGRMDEQVKIRGFRVEPGEIEAVLKQHEEIEEAVVLTREGPDGELELVAFVSGTKSGKRNEGERRKDLREYLRGKLPAHMVPGPIVELTEMPLNENGKVNRRALPMEMLSHDDGGDAYVPPRDAVELQLSYITKELLGRDYVSVTARFFDLGGTSLMALVLLDRIERQFGVKLPLSALYGESTIEHLGVLLRGQSPLQPESSLVPIRLGGDFLPFFCVHAGGGTVTSYGDLATHLGPEQPFYGLQSMGLYPQSKPLNYIEEMAAHYLELVREVQPQGPYHIGGWSMGGLIAYEMAQELLASGQEIGLLAMFDVEPPNAVPISDPSLMLTDEELAIQAFGADIKVSLDDLRPLSPQEQVSFVVDAARRANLLVPDANNERARRIFEVYKSNSRAARAYVGKPYQGCVTLFSCLAASSGEIADPTFGWRNFTDQVEVIPVPGTHRTMVYPPHVSTLAERLSECLSRTRMRVKTATLPS
jgi:thioesterase domain-containing protein/acyl carrier protein